MIISITIGKNFGEYQPSDGDREPGLLKLVKSHHYYPIPALPVGHTIDTSSNLVVIIGDNGTGKSTLLHRIDGHDIILAYDKGTTYEEDRVFHEVRQPRMPGLATEPIRPEHIMSQGTYKLYSLDELLGKYKSEPRANNKTRVLLLDQPEDSISLRNKKVMIERIKRLAFERGVQIFVATHEERFLGIAGSRIINLDERPARSYEGATFDMRTYLG